MKKYLEYLTKRRLLLIGIGFIIGLVTLTGVRAATYNPESVHYHANFALYVNGEREEFSSFTFYEEIQACGTGGSNPKTRVHMHNQENSVVHVHDEGVTWGHFFANLGFGITPSVLETDRGVFQDDAGNKLTFYLNGEAVGSVANRLIGSEDVLLVDYGATTEEEIKQRFNGIERTAGEANSKPDPSTCSGGDGPTLGERIKFALGLQAKSNKVTATHDNGEHAH